MNQLTLYFTFQSKPGPSLCSVKWYSDVSGVDIISLRGKDTIRDFSSVMRAAWILLVSRADIRSFVVALMIENRDYLREIAHHGRFYFIDGIERGLQTSNS